MPNNIYKITTGFVIQEFEKDGTFVGQSFIAGDEVEYENVSGETCDEPDEEKSAPFDMVQPFDNIIQ